MRIEAVNVIGRRFVHTLDRSAKGVIKSVEQDRDGYVKGGVVMVDFDTGPKNHPVLLDEIEAETPRVSTELPDFEGEAAEEDFQDYA